MKWSKMMIVLINMFFVLMNVSGQIISPFNKRIVKDTTANYSFVVSGHFHGESTNISTFPASSILSNIDTINSLHPAFLMSLGDLFLDVNDTYTTHYSRSLFQKLQMPFFNVVGNHDLANNNMYEKIYGNTWFSFQTGSELFIGLNTEVNDGSIKDEQLNFLKNALNKAEAATIKNVFVFSHRPVWAERIKKYEKLFENNTRTTFGKNNFTETVEPLLKKIAMIKQVYWISGSLGYGPASFFYDKDENTNITFMQTAIRNVPRDAVLIVTIKDGNVKFNGLSLTGEKLNPIKEYNVNYWEKTVSQDQQFNIRIVPYLIMVMMQHYFFWSGAAFSFLILAIIFLVVRRWKKRR